MSDIAEIFNFLKKRLKGCPGRPRVVMTGLSPSEVSAAVPVDGMELFVVADNFFAAPDPAAVAAAVEDLVRRGVAVCAGSVESCSGLFADGSLDAVFLGDQRGGGISGIAALAPKLAPGGFLSGFVSAGGLFDTLKKCFPSASSEGALCFAGKDGAPSLFLSSLVNLKQHLPDALFHRITGDSENMDTLQHGKSIVVDGNYKSFIIVFCEGVYYGVPGLVGKEPLGNLSRQELEALASNYDHAFGATLAAVQTDIERVLSNPSPPTLFESNVNGYNIVKFKNMCHALSQAVGSFDLMRASDAELADLGARGLYIAGRSGEALKKDIIGSNYQGVPQTAEKSYKGFVIFRYLKEFIALSSQLGKTDLTTLKKEETNSWSDKKLYAAAEKLEDVKKMIDSFSPPPAAAPSHEKSEPAAPAVSAAPAVLAPLAAAALQTDGADAAGVLREILAHHKNFIATLQSSLARKEDELEYHRKEKETLLRSGAAAEAEAKGLQRLMEEKEKTVARLEAELAAAGDKLAGLSKTIAEKDTVINLMGGKETEIKGLQRLMEEKEKTVARLEAELSAAGGKLAELSKVAAEKDRVISSLGESNSNYYQSVQSTVARLRERVSDSERLLGEKTAAAGSLAAENADLKAALLDREAALKESAGRLEQAFVRLNELSEEAGRLKNERGPLEDSLAESRAELESLSAKLADIKADKETAENAFSALRLEKDNAAAALAAEKERAAGLEASLEGLKKDFEDRGKEIAENARVISELKEEADELAETAADRKIQTEKLEADLSERSSALSAASGRAAGLEAELSEMKNRLAGAESALAARDAAIGALTGERDALRRSVEERDAAIGALTGERDALRRSVEERDAALGALTGERDALRRSADEKDSAAAAAAQRETGLNARAAALSAENSALKKDLEDNAAEARRLKAKFDMIKNSSAYKALEFFGLTAAAAKMLKK
jgi:septal ring factor EnvC (AmiA/AmiB activator)